MVARIAGASVTVGLVLAACGARARPALRVPTAIPTPTYTVTEAAFAANLDPLNGLPAADPDIGRRRPAAFALTATPDEHLPSGAQAAEIMVEARDSTGPSQLAITNVRADARPPFGPLATASRANGIAARALGATLTAADASDALVRELDQLGVPLTLVAAGRQRERMAPDASGAAAAPGWTYSEQPGRGALPTTTMVVAVPSLPAVTWRYDPILTVWQRSVGDKAAQDPNTGANLGVVNVVILTVSATPTDPDWLVGEGPAHLLRDGTLSEGRWVRAAPDAALKLLDDHGMAMAFKPGNTWLMVVGTDATIRPAP
jgi:hypothetical protein